MVKNQKTHLKVLHLVKTGMGAKWALLQMKELVKLGVEVHVALPNGPRVFQYQDAGIHTHIFQCNFPMRQPWRFPQLSNEFRKLVSFIQPDIIHSHFVGTTLTMRMALGKKHNIPRIFQVPGPLHLEYTFFQWMELGTSGSTDYWIGSCQWTCDRYKDIGISSERIFLSYYGTDIDSFVNHPTGKLRQELNIGAKIKIIGMVAFMYAPKRYLGQKRGLKGHEDLIDAIAEVIKTNPDIIGVFIGGAWDGADSYERKVRDYAKKKCGSHIVFLGTRRDVPELYPDLDIVVHPSHSENVGGAVESLLAGRPTIATDVGGFPDLIKTGVTGWLVPPKKPKVLAHTIRETLSNLSEATEMARRGQQLTRQLFDVRYTALGIMNIYHKVLANKIL